jgi:hypothetical protein
MRGLMHVWRADTYGIVIASAIVAATPAAAQTSVPIAEEPPAFLASIESIVASADPVAVEPQAPIVIEARAAGAESRPLFSETFSRVFKDPTTYALPPIVYAAHRLDWDSSQKLFAYGYLEANPKFTLTGRVDDLPISHAAGNRRILRYSASMIGRSILNNSITAIVERRLIERHPEKRKLIRALGWIERSLVTAYWSYRLTHNQVAQWQDNERVLATLRATPAPIATVP